MLTTLTILINLLVANSGAQQTHLSLGPTEGQKCIATSLRSFLKLAMLMRTALSAVNLALVSHSQTYLHTLV